MCNERLNTDLQGEGNFNNHRFIILTYVVGQIPLASGRMDFIQRTLVFEKHCVCVWGGGGMSNIMAQFEY